LTEQYGYVHAINLLGSKDAEASRTAAYARHLHIAKGVYGDDIGIAGRDLPTREIGKRAKGPKGNGKRPEGQTKVALTQIQHGLWSPQLGCSDVRPWKDKRDMTLRKNKYNYKYISADDSTALYPAITFQVTFNSRPFVFPLREWMVPPCRMKSRLECLNHRLTVRRTEWKMEKGGMCNQKGCKGSFACIRI